MEDKLNGESIEEFLSFRAKIYAFKTKKEEIKKLNGMNKNVVKKDISHKDYTDCLFEERNLCVPCRVYDHSNINSTTSNRTKSPLTLTLINDTCWMMVLALCHTVILVCCKYLRNLSIIFSESFAIYFIF